MSMRPGSDTGQPVRFDFEWRRFRIAIASTPQQIEEAQALRWEVFRHEWQGQTADSGLDVDAFDSRADHLLLYDIASGLLIGTYRFIRGQVTEDFYSSTEFHISPFVSEEGPKVELGRACLRREWRSNLSVVGLYQGISAYMHHSRVRWLFGCSSIDSTDPADAVRLSRWFRREGLQIEDQSIAPLSGHELPGVEDPALWNSVWTTADEARAQELLPPLLRTYLRAGARVSQLPVLDPEFGCVDFLTTLDLRYANRSFLTRYASVPPSE